MATHENKSLLQRLREESSITLRALVYALSALLITTQTVQATETITYYHHDALGSPVAATDESGNLLWREDYRPYGERIRKPTTDNKLWYTGKPEEPELGLQYFGARWYDPQLGRFTGIDPVGFDPGNIHSFNRYAYANNNPYSYLDPDGNSPVAVAIAGLAILGLAFIAAQSSVNNNINLNPGPGLNIRDIPRLPGVGLHPGVPNPLYNEAGDDESNDKAGEDTNTENVKETKDRTKGDRFKSGDDALQQLDEIEKAQRKVRQGKSKQIIDDISKSKQRAKNALKPHNIDLDNLDEF